MLVVVDLRVFGCNLELFNLTLVRAFFWQKRTRLSEFVHVYVAYTRLQIEMTVQKLYTVKLPIFSVILACNSSVL